MRLASLHLIASCAVAVFLVAPGHPALAASGHVVDPDGKPVFGARACLLVAGADGLCSVTDAAGYYGLPETSAPWVRITATGFLPKQVSAVDQEAPVALSRAASLLVRLVDRSSGAAISKGEVFLIDSSGKKRGPLPANAAGVHVSSLEPGEVVVQGTAPGHAGARSDTIRLLAGEASEVVLQLDATGPSPTLKPLSAYLRALAAALAALAVTACGGRDPSPPAPAAPPASAGATPEDLYRSWGCSICHGLDRKGGKNAPAITRLSPTWRIDTLADYLLEPGKWRESDPRIRKLAQKYPKLTMPPSNHPEAERRALAAWLLSP